MTATRRHIIRRIHRETGRPLRDIVRNSRGLTAGDISRRLLPAAAAA